MNLLEHYIKDVHSETPFNENNFDGVPTDYVTVDVTIDCWGSIERKTRTFEQAEWETIKIDGYFMG